MDLGTPNPAHLRHVRASAAHAASDFRLAEAALRSKEPAQLGHQKRLVRNAFTSMGRYGELDLLGSSSRWNDFGVVDTAHWLNL